MRAILAGGRIGLALLGSAGLIVLGPGSGQARCDTPVRVLVERSGGPVELGVGRTRHVIAPAPDGIRVDGGKVRARWQAESGAGTPLEAGGRRLEGRLDSFLDAGDVVVVNEVPLERYVAGAIAGEMPVAWSVEALRAQAVVSRTYALHQRDASRDRAWDVESGTRSQVFVGADVPEAARRAADETRCEVLTYGGAPILAAFHSASGGRTASAGEVWGQDLTYLVSMEVPGEDDSPDTYWRAAISRPTLGRALEAAGHPIGEVTEASIEDRTPSGRVRWIRFHGDRGEVRLTGRQLRQALGESTLRSTLFELRPHGEGFVFVGSGRGHGVGMSQWGARSLAERGATYREILERFYPGTQLRPWNERATAALHRVPR